MRKDLHTLNVSGTRVHEIGKGSQYLPCRNSVNLLARRDKAPHYRCTGVPYYNRGLQAHPIGIHRSYRTPLRLRSVLCSASTQPSALLNCLAREDKAKRIRAVPPDTRCLFMADVADHVQADFNSPLVPDNTVAGVDEDELASPLLETIASHETLNFSPWVNKVRNLASIQTCRCSCRYCRLRWQWPQRFRWR